MKKLAVLGSTGSIGTQSLEVARHLGYSVTALTGYSNTVLLEKQCREFLPREVWVNEASYQVLRSSLSDTPVRVCTGEDELCRIAAEAECDALINALLGISGLKPTLAALESDRRIALANKETLVAGGMLVTEKAKNSKAKIIPVDSEHSAIFQCLAGKKAKKIILTGSGGAFFGKNSEYLKTVTLEQALHHPNWTMGAKITVDSSTLMNKGLELIEAVWLFGVRPDEIEIMIQRESVIHSMVEFCDNSVIAQLASPDMRECIQYALTYPERKPSLASELDLTKTGSLHFYKPDEGTFTLLPLARKCITEGGSLPASLNGANEEAVKRFLGGEIRFCDIPDAVYDAVGKAVIDRNPSVRSIFEADAKARADVALFCKEKKCPH